MSTRIKRMHVCRLGSKNTANTALHEAIANNCCEKVLELISRPETKLDEQNADGDTPLLYSLRRANSRYLMDLMDHGCNVNIRNKRLETPLHFAAQRADDFFTCKLLERGADVNARNSYGRTPLHEAVSRIRIANVFILLYYGACVDDKDIAGETPFMTALRPLGRNFRPSDELSRSLLNYVVDFNERDINELTPLYKAILQGSPVALDIIERGANVNQIVLGKHCISPSLTHHEDSRVFRALWSRLNTNSLVKTEYLNEICFLRLFFYYTRFSDMDFLTCLYMIFESPKIDVLVRCFHLDNSEKSSDLMYHISKNCLRQHDQNEELKVVSLLLSYGFEIYFRDVAGLYAKYNFNSCVALLLNNGSAIRESESITNHNNRKSLKVELMASRLCYDHFDIYSDVPDDKLEIHKTEISHYRMFYKAHFDLNEIPNLQNRNNPNRFYTVVEVPSLVQISRDLIRTVFYKKFSTIDYFEVYQRISRLCLPEVIKDILRLKKPIYDFIKDEDSPGET